MVLPLIRTCVLITSSNTTTTPPLYFQSLFFLSQMGNQASRALGNKQSGNSTNSLESYPSFSKSDTQGSSRSLTLSIRRKIKGVAGEPAGPDPHSDSNSIKSEKSVTSLRGSVTANDDDDDDVPQPPPTPPHASQIKDKSVPTHAQRQEQQQQQLHDITSTASPPVPSDEIVHPNAALDTLLPATIDPILIRPSSSDVLDPPPQEPSSPISPPSSPPAFPALDDIIQRLLTTAYSAKITKQFCLDHKEINLLCAHVRNIFMSQPTLLELSPPVKIVGDVHGQFGDLIRMFEMCGWPPKANYLFLGDYVDRGSPFFVVLICRTTESRNCVFIICLED